jgi:orotate phosphoribosyltransferase
MKNEICKIINKTGALQFGVYKLANGRTSPYYIDLRIVPSFPDAFQKICDLYSNFIKDNIGLERFDRIAGIPVAGIPFASQVAYTLKKPFLYVPKAVKLHGRKRRVEGILISGERVLIIDDLITTGLTLRKAAKAIKDEGGVVNDAVVLLDREEGGKRELERDGIKLRALIKVSEVANSLYEIGAIDEEQLKIILKQIRKGIKK